MKNSKWFAAALLAAVCAVGPVLAQEAKKEKAPPKPAPDLAGSVLDQWNDIGRKLTAMAEDFPENKWDYKPASESRTFKANIAHAAGAMYYFTDSATGKKPRYPDAYAGDDLKTKADLVAFVKKCISDGADVIKQKGDQGLQESVDIGDSHLYHLYDLAYGLVEHSGEHYGQLVAYYRANGIVPPESRPKK
jgi:hypothetical protein